MYQSKHIQISSTRVGLFFRIFLLGLLFTGGLFTATPVNFSSPVFAQAAQKTRPSDVTRFKPYVVISPQAGAMTRSHAASQLPPGQRDRPPVPSHPTGVVANKPKVANKSRGKLKPHTVPQDLTITASVLGGSDYQVGQIVDFEMLVTNTSLSTILTSHSGVAVGVGLPAGLSTMVVVANDWATNVSSVASPAVFAALYTGPPILPGGTFPLLNISGVLTDAAIPIFTAGPAVFAGLIEGVTTGGVSVNVSSGPGTATAIPTPPVTPILSPVVDIAAQVSGGPLYQVGQNITITLTVSNIDAINTLGAHGSVYVGDVIPFGLDNLSALGGGNWSINTSSTTGPSLFTSIYTGPPIAPGGTFPPMTVTGMLTSGAIPRLQNLTTTYDNQFPDAASNVAVFQLSVGAVTPTPISTLTPTPVSTATVTPPPLLPSLPDLSLTQSSAGSSMFRIGQTINYALNVSGTATGGPVGPSNVIKVVAVFPVGLKNVTTSGSNWSIMSTSAVSPSLIVATYRGLYPVATGAHLPPILVQGIVLNTAVPQLTSTAVVQVAGDSNPDNNLTNTTIQVSALNPTVVASPSPTPTSVLVSTATVSSVVAPLPISLPDLAVTQSSIGTSPFAAGQQLGYVLAVENVGVTGSVSSLIRLTEVIPIGLTHVSVNAGSSWHITQSSTTSPLLISATYAGSYPVMPGMSLPSILVFGKLSNGIISSMTCTAVVGVAGDRNPSNNMANNTVFVIPTLFPQSRAAAQRQISIHELIMKKDR